MLWKKDHEGEPYFYHVPIDAVRHDIEERFGRDSYEVVMAKLNNEYVGFVSGRSFNDNTPYMDPYRPYVYPEQTGMISCAAVTTKGQGVTTGAYKVLLESMTKKYKYIFARVFEGDYPDGWRQPRTYYEKIGFKFSGIDLNDHADRLRLVNGKPEIDKIRCYLMQYVGEGSYQHANDIDVITQEHGYEISKPTIK